MKAVHLQALILLLMLTGTQFATAADDYKVIKLEQDVRRLEQQVRELTRQVSELRRYAGTSPAQTSAPSPEGEASSGAALWLQAKNWQRLQVGMSELQVIETLGPPTSTRGAADASSRVLLYALEIGTGNFLGGSVELRDRRVVEISTPVLK
jgi:hypothetical protein